MLAGYFLVEWPLFGLGAAVAELVAVNSLQVTFGAFISLALVNALRRAYPQVDSYALAKPTKRETAATALAAVILLAAVTSTYVLLGVSV